MIEEVVVRNNLWNDDLFKLLPHCAYDGRFVFELPLNRTIEAMDAFNALFLKTDIPFEIDDYVFRCCVKPFDLIRVFNLICSPQNIQHGK